MVLAYTGMTSLKEAYDFSVEGSTTAQYYSRSITKNWKAIWQPNGRRNLISLSNWEEENEYYYLIENRQQDWELS